MEELEAAPEHVRALALEMHPEDLASAVDALSAEDARAMLDLLDDPRSADILTRVSVEQQRELLKLLGVRRLAALFEYMSADDRVDLFQLLAAPLASQTLDALAERQPELASEVRSLARWAPETAGGRMTTEFLSLRPQVTAGEAIETVRRLSRRRELETVYYIFVCDVGFQLRGVISLRELILADPEQPLGDILTPQVVSVRPEEDQEAVAATMARYDLSALPVVGPQGRMLGVVTIDDVFDVLIDEATEDLQRLGGMVPLESGYFETGWFDFVWRRATWLVVLFLGQMLTATVMERNEALLQSMVSLVIFVPLIISSGGNAGAQSSSLIIRALALGEVRASQWWRVAGKEVSIGLALGVLLGILGAARASLTGEDAQTTALMALAVGSSIVAVIVLGAVVGAILPLIISRVGFDPAVSSSPMIASLVDVLGLGTYFVIASTIFRLANAL